ncbi:MAG: 16S rRNA (cytosine(967)-C(5))-methyltransferase RsmB [Lachnospiraceae bacterium]|nr:16S rRNA (cytosine(967)-C(5))-methyltransferase RsmB [Lachnospiraceae bacterium]
MGQKQKQDLRNIVLTMLVETMEKQGFSHILIQDAFSKYDLDAQEKAFVERLYRGTLEQILYLDYIIEPFVKGGRKKTKPVIWNILRMCLYQMLFMDSVPDRAAIYEGVRLTEKRGFRNLKGFVNAVLRNVQRGPLPENVPEHIRLSEPKWLYDRMVNQEGKETATLFFEAANKPDKWVCARLNLKEKKKEEILALLAEDSCQVKDVEGIPEAVYLKNSSDLTSLRAFQEGLLFFQDSSAMYPASFLEQFAHRETVHLILDVCAAPGGKALHLAEKYPDVPILARDISDSKVALIEENAKRMRTDQVKSQVWDATVLDKEMMQKADIVIADLPCSGLGDIGSKPEIRYRVKEEDIRTLSVLQRNILETVQSYVAEGGFLSYSTCTVTREENEENAQWFCSQFPFELLAERRFLPGIDDCDGAYVALFQRKKA